MANNKSISACAKFIDILTSGIPGAIIAIGVGYGKTRISANMIGILRYIHVQRSEVDRLGADGRGYGGALHLL